MPFGFMINHLVFLIRVKNRHNLGQLRVVFVLFLFFLRQNVNVYANNELLIGVLFQNEPIQNSSKGVRLSNAFLNPELSEHLILKFASHISNQIYGPYSAKNSSSLLAQRQHNFVQTRIIHLSKSTHLKSLKNLCKEINGNLVALIGPSQHKTFKQYAQSISEDLDLLHFDIEPSPHASSFYLSSSSPSLSVATEPSTNPYSFNVYPSSDVLCRVYGELIKRFQWKHAAIIYDSKTNLRKVNCLLESPGNLMPKLDLLVRNAHEEHEFRSVLRDLASRRYRNIIIDLEPDEAQLVLKMALQQGMINSTYNFLLTTLDIETMELDDFKYNRANITGLRLVKVQSSFYESLMRNFSHFHESQNLKNSIGKNWEVSGSEMAKLFRSSKNALLFDTLFLVANVIREVEKTSRFDGAASQVSCSENRALKLGDLLSTYAEKSSTIGLTGRTRFQNRERKEFDLDVLQLKESGLFKCGTWSNELGLNFTFYDEIVEEQDSLYSPNNAKKTILKVVSLVEEPYVIEKDGKLQGFCIDILEHIAHKMNFRYEIYKVSDDSYGNEDENGTWNGMIKELIDKKADLAVSSLTINFKRQQVVDFTKPFLSLGISILFKVPTSKKPGLFSFLNPLSLEIWIYTFIAYILVSLVLMLLARFSPYEWRKTSTCNEKDRAYVKNQFTIWNSLWFAVGTLMQQGSDINPKALSTRLVGGVWWFFTLIIISSYTANLAAFLTVEKVELTITNIEDLANQTKINYGVFKGGSTMNFFKESRIDTYKRMWKVMKENPESSFVPSNHEGIQRVLRGDYAYLMESPLIDYEIQRNCNLTQIGGLLDSKGYGIATQLGSPYTDEISLHILEMQEKGEIQKYYNRWWKGGSTCIRDEKKDSKANALKVENVGGIFVVLVGGVLIAVVVSLFEFIFYARRNRKQINKPLLRHMFDELRFASKCGGSAKRNKIRRPKRSLTTQSLTNANYNLASLASSNDKPVNFNQSEEKTRRSSSLINLKNKTKPKVKVGEEENSETTKLNTITSDNALVCKNDSKQNVSNLNPGLLIVERETALDAENRLKTNESSTQLRANKKKRKKREKSLDSKHKSEHLLQSAERLKNYNKSSLKNRSQPASLLNAEPTELPIRIDDSLNNSEEHQVLIERQITYDKFYSKSNIVINRNNLRK